MKATPEIKAAAIADLLAGEQPAIVAQRYKLNPSTVRSWKRVAAATAFATDHAPPPATPAVPDRPNLAARQVQIVELVYENLIAKLTASQRLADHAATNRAWLEKQTAEGVAVLGQWLDSTAANTLALLAGRDADSEQ